MASNETCPVCRTAEIVCGKWTLLVIRDLAEGRSRFCELERSLRGISPRTLPLRLRALEEEGILERQTFPEVPPRDQHALTEKGRARGPLLEDMRADAPAGARRGVHSRAAGEAVRAPHVPLRGPCSGHPGRGRALPRAARRGGDSRRAAGARRRRPAVVPRIDVRRAHRVRVRYRTVRGG